MVFSPAKKSNSKAPPRNDHSSSKTQGNLQLQRGPKPLIGKRFYFDIKNHSTSSKLESSIKSFGGVVDPFIGREVHVVVTDRPEWGASVSAGSGGSPLIVGGTPRPSPSPLPHFFSPVASPAGNSRGSNISPATLDSPGESAGAPRRAPKSRAEAILDRVRLQPQIRTRDPLVDAHSWGIEIWPVEKILKLLQKIALSQKKGANDSQIQAKRKSVSKGQKIKCRTGDYFLKIESLDRIHRPSFKDLPCWPTINLDSEPGTSPFNLRPIPVPGNKVAEVKREALKEPAPVKCQVVVPSVNPSTPLRRSPRKKASPTKQLPLTKARNICTTRSPRKSKFILAEKSRLNAITPRPPSKRHPDRSPFPEVNKAATFNAGYEPLAGYCEICKVDYPDLRLHVKTDTHRVYSSNEANYASLDTLVQSKSVSIDVFHSLLSVNQSSSSSKSSVPDAVVPVPVPVPVPAPTHGQDQQETSQSNVNMRQPVDERLLPSKMVGRKEALEVQCNGISNHVQTRFACAKGDRENLGGIFLDERIAAAQLRKRRAISVSCKDLLELSPTGERTHSLRSGRSARSELSQLSPALSDNSHPLLNNNSQQPLLSPTLSDRSHHLRTRSQLWLSSNLLEGGSLLVTANNHSDKIKSDNPVDKVEKLDRSEKCTRVEKVEKSHKSDHSAHTDKEEEASLETKDTIDRDLRQSRIHSRSRSIRRKRLSAEEKLIEDNRGYYKVEVLNSKLRSTGYFVNHETHQEEQNGRLSPSMQGQGPQGEMKEPVVVRFKKVRRSELSVLSDEAENFMFGEHTRSDTTNSEDSSEYEMEEEEDECENGDCGEEEEDEGDEGTDGDGNAYEPKGESRSSRGSLRNGKKSTNVPSGARNRQQRIKIKVGGDSSDSRCNLGLGNALGASGSTPEANGHRKHRKRRSQTEAFITDNMDYYKFEIAGSRLRVHGLPNPPEDGQNDLQVDDKDDKEKFSTSTAGTLGRGSEDKPSDLAQPCAVDNLHFSFESVPNAELWFQTFQRQDRGEALSFPTVRERSTVVLPYQISKGESGCNQRTMGRRRCKNSARLPRKSPRCHASTLAILSSLVRRRSTRDLRERDAEKNVIPEEPVDQKPEQEPKSNSGRKLPAQNCDLQPPTAPTQCGDIGAECVEDIQEIARNIDSMLGFVPSASSDDRDQEIVESKSSGKGRGRKKQGQKLVNLSSGSAAGNTVQNSEKDRDRDPSLNYLVDPAILDELSCTCDVVSNPLGGPTMDIVSLLDGYSECCCIAEDSASIDHVDASCNSSECASTCDMDRRMRKKRKRRNMTGWDKPKKKCILRREALGIQSSEEADPLSEEVKDTSDPTEPMSTGSEWSPAPVSQDLPSSPLFQQKRGNKRKLRSSSSVADGVTKPSGVVNHCRMRGDSSVEKGTGNRAPKRTFRKIQRIAWKR